MPPDLKRMLRKRREFASWVLPSSEIQDMDYTVGATHRGARAKEAAHDVAPCGNVLREALGSAGRQGSAGQLGRVCKMLECLSMRGRKRACRRTVGHGHSPFASTPQKTQTRSPAKDHRTVLSSRASCGFCVAGLPGARHAPEHYGAWHRGPIVASTAGQKRGIWPQVLEEELQKEKDGSAGK